MINNIDNEYKKWSNLSNILYKHNNNNESIIEIFEMIQDLCNNNNLYNYLIMNNYTKIQLIIDSIYNYYGAGICNNRKEYEFYLSLNENNLEKINNKYEEQLIITEEGLHKFNQFRKYLELLQFVMKTYDQNISLISENLPKWFVIYIGLFPKK